MPHKRAKRAVREQHRSQKGSDLAPSHSPIADEPIPKSIARVLNAAQVRGEWKDKKRKLEDDDAGPRKKRRIGESTEGSNTSKKGKSSIKILPGESLRHFNQRVEDDMRPLVRTAMQSSLATARSVKRTEQQAITRKPQTKQEQTDQPQPSPPPEKHAGRPKEFQTTSSSAPRRLNDVAQAPPEFKKTPRGATAANGGGTVKRDSVVSMAQKVLMEAEREKAIARYRELKEMKRREGASGRERDTG